MCTVAPQLDDMVAKDKKLQQTAGDIASLPKTDSGVLLSMKPSSTVLVVLFGWAGCRDRYLAKYTQYYEEHGYSTIRFTTPIAKVRSFASYHDHAKLFYRDTIETGTSIPDNVFFHVFSMNGCSQFAAFWDLLRDVEGGDKFKQKVKGIIYDSAPAFTTPAQSANAISFACLPPSKYHFSLRATYRAILYTFFSVHRGVIWMQSLMNSEIYQQSYAYFRMLAMDDLPQNQLYLYGPKDEVCSLESIEHFATEMEKRGISTTKKCLQDSLHCQHYRTYPQEYTDTCLTFIDTLVDESSRDSTKSEVSKE